MIAPFLHFFIGSADVVLAVITSAAFARSPVFTWRSASHVAPAPRRRAAMAQVLCHHTIED
jgi:hypothetical protein